LSNRCKVDTLPGIYVELFVLGERDSVHSIGVGEFCQAGAIEVDPIDLGEVRILRRNDAAGVEIDLTLGVIDIFNVAHQPIAFGDLVFQRAGDAVVEIKVFPAITL
jgi:hypothetical protein